MSSQIPEHVQRGHRAPADKAWGKEGLPTPQKSAERKQNNELKDVVL